MKTVTLFKNPGRSIITFALLAATAGFSGVQAQVFPFPYRGVAYAPSGNILVSSTIHVKLSFLQSAPDGPVVYEEMHTPVTDARGNYQLNVGRGNVLSGKTSAINLYTGEYYLQIGVDAYGNNEYRTIGVMPLLKAPQPAQADSTGQKFEFALGEEIGGGIVFHRWKDANGAEHGLVVSLNDLEYVHDWEAQFARSNDKAESASTPRKPATAGGWTSLSSSNNNNNSKTETEQSLTPAAKVCRDYKRGGFTDWYLPSVDELRLLWLNRNQVNEGIKKIKGATPLSNDAYYWSRTKYEDDQEWTFSFGSGNVTSIKVRLYNYKVRAIRAY